MALTDSLVAYWKLDDNGSGGLSLVDSSGNSHTLTNNGSVTLGTGKIGGCASIAGDNSNSLTVPSLSAIGTEDFAFSFWFNSSNFDPHGGGYYSTIYESNYTNGVLIRPKTDGSALQVYVAGTSNDFTHSLSTSTWYHAVISRSSGVVTCYINGASIGTASLSGNATVSDTSKIGQNNRDGSESFSGLIDEFAIWSRALSSSEITSLFNSGAGLSYPFTLPNPWSLKTSGGIYLF